MTREEFRDYVEFLRSQDEISYDVYSGLIDGIDTLEQEPVLDKIRAEIEQLPTKTRINWDGCCPDIDYPEIEYVDVTKKKLLSIIDKYKAESEE
jgi:hypothetical protein